MRIVIAVCFVVLLAVPLLFRPAQSSTTSSADALPVIIITPHNEQIRYEFGRAFNLWHQRKYGQPANAIWSVPGGTSEIRRMLEAQFTAALEAGKEPGGDADLVFGGGSFEFGRLKKGVVIKSLDGKAHDEPITAPVDFSDAWLGQTYGENRIGDDPLYDKDKYWFGVAMSGFGIVYNRDVLRSIGLNDPQRWSDVCDPRLQGWVALVNPSQSGSVTTAFDAILKRHGWEEGWRVLRRMGANARYFSAVSLKPPIDVTHGDAAVGVSIDFYGRYQSQVMKEAGDPDRLGYVDPVGGSTIDVDPIAMLRNAPHPQTARRFIEFCLSEEGQALWQFRKHSGSSGDQLGPERFELRRLPALRSMYQNHKDQFVDQVNPFETMTPVEHPNPNYRDFIAPLFAAMVMDNHRELKRAWKAITSHPLYGTRTSDPRLTEMLRLFDAMPEIEGPSGATYSLQDEASLALVRNGWLRGGWKDQNLWNPEDSPVDVMRRRFGEFFREKYRRIVEVSGTSWDGNRT